MEQMKDKIFADSNVFLYLLSDDERKKAIAKEILKKKPVISVQVISENINVLIKKFTQLKFQQIEHHTKILSNYCSVSPVTILTIETALALKKKYGYQWYDCTILSSALLDDCAIIYSEDMQHNQLINEKLKIINPFIL